MQATEAYRCSRFSLPGVPMAQDKGSTRGTSMPMVPQLEPVAKAVAAEIRNTSVGNRATGSQLPKA